MGGRWLSMDLKPLIHKGSCVHHFTESHHSNWLGLVMWNMPDLTINRPDDGFATWNRNEFIAKQKLWRAWQMRWNLLRDLFSWSDLALVVSLCAVGYLIIQSTSIKYHKKYVSSSTLHLLAFYRWFCMNSFRVAKPSSGLFMVGFSTYPSPFVHYSWLRNAPDEYLLCKREE